MDQWHHDLYKSQWRLPVKTSIQQQHFKFLCVCYKIICKGSEETLKGTVHLILHTIVKRRLETWEERRRTKQQRAPGRGETPGRRLVTYIGLDCFAT